MLLFLLMIFNINSCISYRTHDYNDDESTKTFDDIIEPTRRQGPHPNIPKTILDIDRTDYSLAPIIDEEEIPVVTRRIAQFANLNYEPQVPPKTIEERLKEDEKRLDCESFALYVANCTLHSALLYNSSKKSPPMPAKMEDWCSAIRHLTNCAVAWNSECTDVTEQHFNEESIKGHIHVVTHICDDEYFRTRYDELTNCIDTSAKAWEKCYVTFKHYVDELKNLTKEWTHYKVHFKLCCARTKFRRCTLDALFMNEASKCTREEAMVLQKFSVFTSAGEVYQDCENNMLYDNCPGGDPRPSTSFLSSLMNGDIEMRAANKVITALHEENSSAVRRHLLSFIFVLLSFVINLLW